MPVDGVHNPVACFYIRDKDDCRRSYGCEWTYRGEGHCRPDYALGPIKSLEDAKRTIDRVVFVINNVPSDMLWRAWKEATYLVNALPRSSSWDRVPPEARHYIMWEGKERVYDAYLRRAEKEGIKTRIARVPAVARRV